MAKIKGTNGKDRLVGTSDGDVFYGYDDDDEFFGSGNMDTYYGGAGIDTVNYGGLKGGPAGLLGAPGVTVNLKLGYGYDHDGFRETFYYYCITKFHAVLFSRLERRSMDIVTGF